jgi:uncharacterized heparinase superfamily protein
MSLKDLPRLARTVAHLRPSQIYWRGRYALRRHDPLQSLRESTPVPAPGFVGESITRLCEQDLPAMASEVALADDQTIVNRLSQGIFRHFHEERTLGRPPDWLLGPRDHGRLWTVTLHYHQWAWELAAIVAASSPCAAQAGGLYKEYVADWIDRCDLSHTGARQLAWNSYAIGTRLGWWARSAVRLGSAWWSANPQFRQRFLSSFWSQADHLANNIEWDLRGNHLVRDAVGLAWAGRFWDRPEAQRWLEQATALALDQATEQVLADGGHFERSPMYHKHVMDDFGLISRLVDDAAARERLQAVVARMNEFATWMRHPDGGPALFNDAALDDEPSHLHAGPTNGPIESHGGRHFADTGLAVWHGTRWTLFFDVGPIGPDYQPGHGHADNLTLECSYDGERLFVDPGTHSYDLDDQRAYDRSTAAHNTVCVDDTNSSEVWHIFRVGRRARPIDVRVHTDDTTFDASAAHDGYARLGVIHRRHVRLTDDETLSITDRIEGSGLRKLAGGWLLAPGWTATPAESGWQLQFEGKSLRVRLQGPTDLQLSLEERPWHPRFGVEIPTARLAWRWDGPLPCELTTTVSRSS